MSRHTMMIPYCFTEYRITMTKWLESQLLLDLLLAWSEPGQEEDDSKPLSDYLKPKCNYINNCFELAMIDKCDLFRGGGGGSVRITHSI